MLMLLCWNLPSSSDWCLELLFQVYEHVPFSSYVSFCLVRNTKGVILRYVAALEAFKNRKSMKAAFDAVGVDRNTVAVVAVH